MSKRTVDETGEREEFRKKHLYEGMSFKNLRAHPVQFAAAVQGRCQFLRVLVAVRRHGRQAAPDDAAQDVGHRRIFR